MLKISGNFTKTINFAMQQNYVPVIRNLVIQNDSSENLKDLTVRITFSPAFAEDYEYEIEGISAGESLEIAPVRIRLSTDFLFGLTEKISGFFRITVWKKAAEEVDAGEKGASEKLAALEEEIELLAYDQWSGLSVMPEMIAAFVTPNHPEIAKVLSEASGILKGWGEDPSFTGYQTRDPNQVKLQMAAVYAALKQRQIVYHNPPAGYEKTGQRIRLPHIVLKQKQGTCLDLAVLYAACLEAAGLYPLLVFLKGHAFVGCWLEEETFADCMVDDVSSLEKRTVPGAEELLLAECTDFVEGRDIPFDKALKHGLDHLAGSEEFHGVVDIMRSRGSGIRPMPLRTEDGQMLYGGAGESGAQQENGEAGKEPDFLTAPEMLDTSLRNKTVEDSIPVTKQKIWERKLLDFSLRNTLLNFRVTKNAIQLMVASAEKLEDELSGGKDFRIMEVPGEWTVTLRDSRIYEIENEKDLVSKIAEEEFKNGRIRTFLEEEELEKALKGLYRSAKMSMEENGTNTLFLALGFLRWYESEISQRARFAPIVLLPVDIVRNARNKGYLLRSRQEDAQVNITLLEYLRQDHGVQINGLDPLPEDENGVDLPLVFHIIRQAILDKKRWNIEEMAYIGLFSFGQFVMWNDIHSRCEELADNKVVASLMKGEMTWEAKTLGADTEGSVPQDPEERLEAMDMAVPVSADSSQMAAIAAAACGESFVLHGPPGTGKSQTITNMIANALFQGKSVLFVAEKMAALTVVQRRLAAIGLDPFCLELHSNKTNKSAVLAELNKALETAKVKSPEEYEKTAQKVHLLRSRLSSMMEAVHKKRLFGCSLYEAIEICEKNKAQKGKIRFSKKMQQTLSGEKVEQYRDLVRRYAVAMEAVGDYTRHPLKGYEGKKYSIELKEQLKDEIEEILNGQESVCADADKLYAFAGNDVEKTDSMMEILLQAAGVLGMPGTILAKMLTAPGFSNLLTASQQLIALGKDCRDRYEEICAGFAESVLDYPFETAALQFKQADSQWFAAKFFKQNKLIKELRLYAKEPKSITNQNITQIYDKLSAFAGRKRKLQETPAELTGYYPGIYMGLSTNWENLEGAVRKTARLKEVLEQLPGTAAEEVILHLEIASEKELADLKDSGRKLEEFRKKLEDFCEKYEVDSGVWQGKEAIQKNAYPTAVFSTLQTYEEHLSMLRSKVNFNQIDEELKKEGLEAVSRSCREGKVKADEMMAAFLGNLYYGLALLTIAGEPELSDFRGRQYDDMIARYREAIEEYKQLTIQELVARLSAKIPASGSASSAASEMGILKKAIKNNGRMMSLRRLFDQIPTLLRRLCPCMLMSPISVAQYIDPSFPKFDLVIFDEASQLPTSEAVGTIARGDNVVIVGDPKQLPPTNFFTSNRIDEENGEKEDLESLLDDCLAISMPQESLKWHYRSRHESLIAYSNMKYYDNKLYTFPSPRDLVSEVKFVPVKGVYDKGKTKQNKAEAQAIVAEIIRRLRDENLRRDSIGVVTFSSVQQNLIDDMLFEEFKKYPQLEEIDRNLREPVFIKNLENVQGDERDVILFSVGYGPDAKGNVSMNFGPLNREGGWRRLNVAISRARKSMIIYSVLQPEQIDLARTRAEGVAGLKGFLEFAKRGKNILAQRAGTERKQEDYLVEEIARAAREMGYDVKCNIGCSAYRVDLGIVDPEDKETYLLGILLDGENCYRAANAKDCFVLQPGVLKGLGWSVLRIWTLDWLDDPEAVKEQIRQEAEKVIARKKEESTDSGEEEEESQEQNVPVFETAPEEENASAAESYHALDLDLQGTAEEFYFSENILSIRVITAAFLHNEAPISRKALMRKVQNAWSISRSGSRVESVFDVALNGLRTKRTVDEDRIFFWRPDQDPDSYAVYRVLDADGDKRTIDEIPSQEIRTAMMEVLREQIGLSEADLLRETARKFGFPRMGVVIENCIRYAMNLALDAGLLRRAENGNIVAVE